MSPLDTIAAIATPIGEGGLAVIRVSGPDALAVAELLGETGPPPGPGGGPPLFAAGVGALAVGGVALGAGLVLYLLAADQLARGIDEREPDKRAEYKATGEPLYYAAIVAAIVGGVAVAAGAGLLIADVALE